MMNDFREVPENVRQQLIARRDAFEDQFKSLVAELPLPSGINRFIYRNLLLSMLNAVGDWYRAGDLTPGEIASQIVMIFRHDRSEEHTSALQSLMRISYAVFCLK